MITFINPKGSSRLSKCHAQSEADGESRGKAEGREKGIAEGREKGIAEGKAEAKIEIARSLLDVLPVEMISQKTGLSVSEIEELRGDSS